MWPVGSTDRWAVCPYTGLSGPLQRPGGPHRCTVRGCRGAVRGDSGGRPESPRVLRTAPGRNPFPGRVRSYGASRGADATLCGGASTSSPPARTRCVRVTDRPTHPGTVRRDVREVQLVLCVLCLALLEHVVPVSCVLSGSIRRRGPCRSVRIARIPPLRISRPIDGSVPIDIDADCSRGILGVKDP